MGSRRIFFSLSAALVAILAPTIVSAAPSSAEPTATRLVSGLPGSFGSTIGPGGDLYVAEGVARRVSRIDPETGAVTTFAADGHRLCSLTATTTGDGLLAAFDSSGRVRASWP